MYRNEIRLDTLSDIKEFNKVATELNTKIILKDDGDNSIDAKSILGLMFTIEWRHIYCYSDVDISGRIIKWIK